jgi:hypothetical protein
VRAKGGVKSIKIWKCLSQAKMDDEQGVEIEPGESNVDRDEIS